jgi:hypothetical protein
MTLTFSLREFGHAFATRGRGRELREVLLSRLPEDEQLVEIDLGGVTNISYSFADELLGVLVSPGEESRLTLRLTNVDLTIERVVNDAISRRRGELTAC